MRTPKVYAETLPSGRRRCRWREAGAWHKSLTVGSKAELAVLRLRIEARLAANLPTRVGSVDSLRTIAHAWAKAKVAEGNHPQHTANTRGRLLSFFDRYGLVEVADLTPATIQAIRTGERKPLDPRTDPEQTQRRSKAAWSARTGAMVRAMLTWAADRRGATVDRSVLVALRPTERPRARRSLVTDDVVAGWLRHAQEISPSAHALVHCLLLYGWRPITAARLRVSDLDIDAGTLRTEVKSRRGTRPHVHPLRAETVELLRPIVAGRRPTDAVFTDPRTGDAFAETDSNAIPQWWRDHLGDLGGMSYDAKRFACTRLLRQAPATEARFVTGHASARQLELYAVTNDDRARAIVDSVPALPTRGHTMGTDSRPPVNDPHDKKRKKPANDTGNDKAKHGKTP